jgi:hypothetical protein
MEHVEYERMIEARIAGELSPERIDHLHDHLRSCNQCARLYERFVEAEQALCGSAAAINVLQRDRVEARLLASARPPKAWWAWSFRAQLGLAAITASLLALFLLVPPDEFASRGGGATLSSDIELRALAIEPRPEGGFAVHPASGRTLGLGDHLRLLVENEADFDFITVELVGDKRVVLLERHPIARTTEAKLGDPIAVNQAWPEGEVQIRAVFFRGENRAPSDASASDGDDWAVRTVKARVELP